MPSLPLLTSPRPLVQSAPVRPAPPERVCLIVPPSAFLLDERVFVNLGILRVAAVLERAGVTVEMLDLSGLENFEEIAEAHLRASTATAVGITTTTPQLPAAMKIARRVRAVKPSARLILGGPHVTLTSAAVKRELKRGAPGRAARALEVLRAAFDVLVAGDGEFAIFEALAELKEGGAGAAEAARLVDADERTGGMFMSDAQYEESPLPARHLIDLKSYKYTIDGASATSVIFQLGCPFSCSFSLTGDAQVFVDGGFRQLRDLVDGPAEVESCTHGATVRVHALSRPVSTKDGLSTATAVVEEGVHPILELLTENGLRLKGTATHPMLTLVDDEPDWRELRTLKPGDWLIMRQPSDLAGRELVRLSPPVLPKIPPGGFQRVDAKAPDVLTEDLAWLTGYLIGDGCLPQDGRPAVHLCVFDENREKLTRIVWECFNVELRTNKSINTTKMDHGWVHSRLVYDFFVQSLGISPKDKLHVPQAVRRSPANVIRAFLTGLWDADGYMADLNPYLTTISANLAQEVALLMLTIGRPPNIQEVSTPLVTGGITYRVSELRQDRIPTEKSLCKNRRGEWRWRAPKTPTRLGVRRRTLIESGLEHHLNKEGWFYVRVQSITPKPSEVVYDLRVPKGENFIANGLVVHNCGGRNTKSLRVIRNRSVQSAVAEVEHLHKMYGYTGFMCYDDMTDILTRQRGFIRFSDLAPTDEVAVLDPGTNEMKFEIPKRIVHLEHNGQLVEFRNRYVDLAVTPEHRMWVKNASDGVYRHLTATDTLHMAITDEAHFQQHSGWGGTNRETFSIPAYETVYLGRGKGSPKVQRGSRVFPAKTWIQFMAWYLSEGSTYRSRIANGGQGYRTCIKQSASANPDNVREIKEVLNQLPYNYSYSSDQFHIDSRELYEYLRQFGHSYDKFIPPEFKELSPELLLLFLRTYIKGDGHTSPTGQETITSFSERMRGDLQEIALKCGYWATLDNRHRVLLRKQRDSRLTAENAELKTHPYAGTVHCVTVSTGVVLVRRNGKPVWCGNCYDDEINISKTLVPLMDGLTALQQRLGVEFRLRGFVKAELFTDEQAAAMKRAGFRWILTGFEAADERILLNINKKAKLMDNNRVMEIARRHGLKVKALMSVGHAGESEETVLAVRDWLLKVRPDDFDCSIITPYPGTPYYDDAVPGVVPGAWTFTAKSGDRLHSYDVDYSTVADYVKGDPDGGYHSYVFTDYLSGEKLVELRNLVEREVRAKLNIPFNRAAAVRRYEHSMGQGPLPPMFYRESKRAS